LVGGFFSIRYSENVKVDLLKEGTGLNNRS
jgi:hypothetical protein